MARDNPFDGPETAPEHTNSPEVQDMAARMAAAVSEGLSRLQPIFQSIENRLAGVESQTGKIQDPTPPEEPGTDDELQALADNPKSYISKAVSEIVSGEIQKEMGPLVNTMTQDKAASLYADAKEKMTERYGEKAWEDVFDPSIRQVMGSLPAEQRSSQQAWNTTLSAIRGSDEHFDTLADYAKGVETEKSKESHDVNLPSVLPLGRPRGATDRVGEDERSYFKEVAKHTGRKIDEKEWLSEDNLGNSEDDWLPHLASLEKDSPNGR